MTRRLVPLFLALCAFLAAVAFADRRPSRLIAAHVTPTGELLTATLRGTDRVVFDTRKGDVASSEEVELVGLPQAAEVVDARLGRFRSGRVLALVLRRGATYTYHYAAPALPSTGPVNPFPQLPRYAVSEALFESDGRAYRVLSAEGAGGNAIEIVFQRGHTLPAATQVGRGEGPAELAGLLEQRIYHNARPAAGQAAGALWDVTGLQAAR